MMVSTSGGKHVSEHPVLVVLVHGGFLGPWSWVDVATTLDRRGIATVVPDLPSMGDPSEAPSLLTFGLTGDQSD
ncbi:MAG: alpha/beta fold hydrolase [Pseudonocardiaceae bacterium]